MIDENKIMVLIATELKTIIDSDNETFGNINFEITNEQQYIKDRANKEKNKVFIVIKFYPATLNFGQTLLPIQMDVVSELNKLDISKKLLLAFSETYNLEFNSDMTIKQYYQSPSVLQNFGEIGVGFRSLLTLRGTLQISENANLLKSIRVIEGNISTNLDFITSNVSFDVQLETQSLYNQDNITRSWARVGTLVVNFSVYLTNSTFCNDVLYIMTKNTTHKPDGIATKFKLKLTFKNGIELIDDFLLANATFEQNVSELPVINLTFTL